MFDKLLEYNGGNEGIALFLNMRLNEYASILPRSIGNYDRQRDIQISDIGRYRESVISQKCLPVVIPHNLDSDLAVLYVNRDVYIYDSDFDRYLDKKLNVAEIELPDEILRVYKDIEVKDLDREILYLDSVFLEYYVKEINKDIVRIYLKVDDNSNNLIFRPWRRERLLNIYNKNDEDKVELVLYTLDYEVSNISVVNKKMKGDYRFYTNKKVNEFLEKDIDKDNILVNDKAYDSRGILLEGYVGLYKKVK